MVMMSVTPGALPTGSSTGSVEGNNIQTHFEVDQSLPTTSVQVRLVDGTRCDTTTVVVHVTITLIHCVDWWSG